MKLRYLLITILLVMGVSTLTAQNNKKISVDYNNPQKYVIGGIRVVGNTYYTDNQLIQLSGLYKGQVISVPGDAISDAINRLWAQHFFKNVSISIDSLSSNRDSVFLCLKLKQRPRVASWSLSGIGSGDKKDLNARLNLRRGAELSPYVETTVRGIINRYYREKGYDNCKVITEVKKDPRIKEAIDVNFKIERGRVIKVKHINFIGAKGYLSDYQMAKAMKKTKSARWYNLFSSKKFNPEAFAKDKQSLIEAFNQKGYRDARIIRDSIYKVKPGKIDINIYIDPGKKYYFRHITWTGNSVYGSDALNKVIHIKKGDVYDMIDLQKRLMGDGKPNDLNVAKLYRDNGYLFFNIQPVETRVKGDSVDVEIRIVEGKPATLNNIIITGNTITNERVIRRQLFTRPGNLFSQSDFERSIRELASLQLFDPQALMDPSKGYSIIPNQLNNTVDIAYNVTEKPSSQFSLSGGWSGYSFVGTVGLSFNNFSTRNFFDKSAWRPVPLGDGQTLSFNFTTNGRYYTSLSASFIEPWLFGKKPISLSVSTYYSKQTNATFFIQRADKKFEVLGFSAGVGQRLNWPDNYFVLYNQINWKTYRLTNWFDGTFLFNNGISNDISYTISLSRNSTDQPIYPKQGSDITLSLQLTPPYSLFRHIDLARKGADGKPLRVKSYKDIDYSLWSSKDRYRWIEYHKWTFRAAFYQKLVGDLVLMTRSQFGYLGEYNRSLGPSPFEGFLVGGDGMSGYNSYGSDVIGLRGYENYSLTPTVKSSYSGGYSYSGNVYDKFTMELRYPIIMQPQSQIFVLAFLEGGNAWSDIRDFNPFLIKRSAGVGVRIFLNIIGLLGIDWGYGFDDPVNGGSQFHFTIGKQF